MKTIVVIPARYSSVRLPGKPLEMIGKKSMIQRVYEQASKSKHVNEVWVATDDLRISDHVSSWGGKVVLTNPDHPSGTDRCMEAYTKTGSNADIIINVQGDEPFLQPEAIDELIMLCKNPSCRIATLVRDIRDEKELHSASCVKAVLTHNGQALYFSRLAIPFNRHHGKEDWIKHHTYYTHIGMYGFKADVLKEITQLPVSPLEKSESLEQLRWLENGYSIHAGVTRHFSAGIDTPEDLEWARKSVEKE